MARERERRGLQDGGDRTATIARWLRQKVRSERVTELVLTAWTGDLEPEVLARYPRDEAEANATLGEELSSLIQDYADDAGTSIFAQVAWCTAEGQSWTSKRFRGRCTREAEEVVHPLDGSMQATLQQQQRHNEATVQQLIQMSQQLVRDRDSVDDRYARILDSYDRMNERLLSRLEVAESVAEEAAEAVAEATEVAEEAAAVAEEATQAAENAGENDRLAKVIEIAAKQLTGG